MQKLGTPEADWPPPLLWEWMESVTGEQQWLIEKFLPADSNILLSGKAKLAYKSWWIFQLSLVVASGKTVGPFAPTAAGPVLVLEAEGARVATKKRFEWLAKSSGVDLKTLPIRFSHRKNILLDDPKWVKRIADLVVAEGVKLVVIDPWVMHMSGDENSTQDTARAMRAMVEFRKYGASCLFVHHLSKTQKDWDRDVDEELRGSSALQGFYDLHIAIRNKRPTTGSFNDATFRFKDDEEAKYRIKWLIDKHEGTATFDLRSADDESLKLDLREEVLTMMMPLIEYAPSRIKDALEASLEEVEKVLVGLVKDGLVEQAGRNFRMKAA